MCGRVFGFPSLPFGNGVQQQHRLGWHIGIGRYSAFPPVGTVFGTVAGLNVGGLEELTNGFAAFDAVVIESLFDHFRETKTRRPVMPRCSDLCALPCTARGSSTARRLWLDAIKGPHRAPG